jgi:hypothetical protein
MPRDSLGTSRSAGRSSWACSPTSLPTPGGITPRREVPHLVVHLERRTGGTTGVPGPGGQPRQRGAQAPQRAAHDAERGLDKGVQLLIGLIGVGEEPGEHLKQHLVSEVEQLGHLAGDRVGQQRLRVIDVEGLPGEGGNDRPGGLEGRVLLAQLLVFAPDAEEPAVMRRPPVSARPLTLLYDLVDGRTRRRQVRHSDQLRPAEPLRRGLRPRLTHEQHALAEPVGQIAQALFDPAVQVPDGRETLRAGHHLGRAYRLRRRRSGDEFRRIHALHALWPLQVQEMSEGVSTERQQRELHARREVLRVAREVRP